MSDSSAVSLLEMEKQAAAEAALRFVQSGMTVGLGTGSTAAWFIRGLGRRIAEERLDIRAVVTSDSSQELARSAGIPLITPSRGLVLDLTVDGADEIAPDLSLIKGGGGALLREKVVAAASRVLLIIADSTKCVSVLGTFPLPVEVIPFALPWVMDRLEELDGAPEQRRDKKDPAEWAVTDQGNWIVDCRFGSIPDPEVVAAELEVLPGVVDHGLFLGLARAALVARGQEVQVLQPHVDPIPVGKFSLADE